MLCINLKNLTKHLFDQTFIKTKITIYFCANSIYNLRVKGMITLLAENKLQQLVDKQNGFIQTSDALDVGVSKPTLYKYLDEQDFKKVAHGIFVSPTATPDPMYIISLRSKQAIFSHDSALYLHDMVSKLPENHTVTVRTGYNPSNLTAGGIKVYTIKAGHHELGLTSARTASGYKVPTYNIERTICDVIRSRNDMDSKTFQDALKNYAKRTDRDIKLLMEYARTFRVDKILMKYLEVLL